MPQKQAFSEGKIRDYPLDVRLFPWPDPIANPTQSWPINLFAFFGVVGHIAEEFQNVGLDRLFPEFIIECIHINTDSF
jgi:hypothetical protein